MTGIVVTGCIGLVFGLLYLRLRSLWPLVIAHGLVDTIGLVALYAGLMPA
ncbi:CPBP family glutamic-type intramembrane protease [Arenimonas daejeonensis]|nr:CPBP family glutamic-type intramembrane protease [Arenimonas daejeonensis]